METFPYIPNESIDFIIPKLDGKAPVTKFCPICSEVIGTIGIIHATPKLCHYCSRTLCKICANRKIASEKRTICRECYTEGLKDHYMIQTITIIADEVTDCDKKILQRKEEWENLQKRYKKSQEGLNRLKEESLIEWGSKSEEIFPILEKHKATKDVYNENKKIITKKDHKLEDIDKKIFKVLKQKFEVSNANIEKRRILEELRHEISLYNNQDEGIIEKISELPDAEHPDEKEKIQMIKSVNDLRRLASLKLKENIDLNAEIDSLENEISEIDKEIHSYDGRKSCRYSGSFDIKDINHAFAKSKELETVSELDSSVGEERTVEEIKKIYEDSRKSNDPDDVYEQFECMVF
ncbi:hypothetical protein SteCoe_14702 [Stentor coeruleus]|uniref:Uncharacterized protein n=1 Tax=Stentor coeruleus TaxID=5963 RepID=A0A1R2C5J6_9CILI|nr:hypothetical protein SteCoe_14702 [Stentor coeruleus]